MLDDSGLQTRRTIHIIDSDHTERAALAMRVAGSGGHPEIYEDGDELIEGKPTNGVVLLRYPEAGVARLSRQLAAGGIFLPIIVFAQEPRPTQVVRATHDGAAHFLDAAFSGEELMCAYEYSARFVEQNGATLARRQRAEEQVAALSKREREILVLLLEGHSNKSMGLEMNLSPRTVEDYRLNALRKLGVTSTSAAIRIGLEADLKPACAMLAPQSERASVSELS